MGSSEDRREMEQPPAELPAGAMVGGYQVTEKVGQGGMGQVYAASHPLIGKKVAIKILARHCVAIPDLVRRFMEEARAVNKIGHPHIIDIFSFGQLPDGRHFMVMEYLEGKNLAQRLERETIPVPELRRLLRQICEALQAAHQAGIVHRDLKPENIWIVQKGQEPSHIKLLDFGIAKLLGVESERITQTGAAMGTPQFMPPEQCLGRTVDHRADIYSFGIILYLIFTGTLPFNGSTLAEIVYRHTTEPPEPPSRHRPLPADLEKLILDCLAKDPDLRPATAREVASRLDAALTGPAAIATVVVRGEALKLGPLRTPEAAPRPSTYPPPTEAPPPRARPAAAAAVLLAVGTTTLVAGLALSREVPVPPERVLAAAVAAETRLAGAIASRGRTIEPRVAAAARVPQMLAAVKLIGTAGFDDVKATVQDVFEHEEDLAPFLAPPAVSALVAREGTVAAVGPGLVDLGGAELVRRARDTGMASGVLGGRDRVFFAAATTVGAGRGGGGGAEAPVVLVGLPADHAAFQSMAEQTGDAVGLSDGTRLLEAGLVQEPRRALDELIRRPGRGVLLDEGWAGTVVPVDGKLSLLSVFTAPRPARPPVSGVPLTLLGGALLLGGGALLLRSRRRVHQVPQGR
jgi:eukaryotic-like serine/threonine-protein kinase